MEPTSAASLKFEKFAASFDGQETEHIDNLRQVFTNPRYKLNKARDLYPFYASLQKILGETSQQPDVQRKLLKVLRLENGREIGRVGMPPIALDFAPFLNREESLNTLTLHSVDPFNHKEVAEAACIVDKMIMEGIGKSFGSSVYQAIIGSKQALCVFGKTEDKIVGCLLGTLVYLPDGRGVFHIWACVRKANNPGIGFVSILNSLEREVIQRFNPCWITFCVDEDNDLAHQLYLKSGFEEVERARNDYSEGPVIFMARCLRATNPEPPKMETVRDLVKEYSVATLGFTNAIYLMLVNKITEFANQVFYD